MQLSPHFSLEELTITHTGIANTPPVWVIDHLSMLANSLEKIRALLGNKPLHISSGYRSRQVNHAIHGARFSKHMLGFAADIEHDDYTPFQLCEKIAGSGIEFDQIIHEFTWCHFGIDYNFRKELLTAEKVNGIIRYRYGL